MVALITAKVKSFLHLASLSMSCGEYLEESNTVYKYGLPELTRDILERIRSATGQPINTKHFFPILASSSKDYEITEHQPLTKYSKYLTSEHNKALEGNKGLKHKKDHNYDLGEKEVVGKDLVDDNYGGQSGHQHNYHEGRFVQRNHHDSNKGKKGRKSKKGGKRGKFHVEKGFRDIYHKDEEKKSDYFWNNQHEEGKWIEYGFKNKKSKKSNDTGEEGKKENDKTEESSYEKKENKCLKSLKPPLILINNDITYLHISPQIIALEQYQGSDYFSRVPTPFCIEMKCLKFIWFILSWTMLPCQENIKLVVITEINSNGIPQQLSEGIKLAEEKYSNELKMNMDVLPLIRTNEAESYTNVCGRMEGGVSVILDLTWSGWDKLKNFAADAKVPYLRVDITVRSFVKAMNDFLVFRNGTDSALIFENEMEIDQALYYMIKNSIIRVIVLDRLGPKHIKGLTDMRPTASFHTIFASTELMQEMFRNATEGDIVKRDGRWNLIFTDFKFDTFNLLGVKILTNLITMKKEICCQLLNVAEGCECPDDFKLIPTFLLNFGVLLGDVLSEILSQNVKIQPVKVECGTKATEEYENGTDFLFIQTLTKLLVNHKSLDYDSSEILVHWKTAMDIHVANETQNTTLGTWSYQEGFSLVPGQIMKPDKRFFRIGLVPDDVPWSYQEEDPKTKEMVWQGYCVDLAYKLSEMMNFDFEFSIPKNGDYGQKMPNGQWNGVVGDLARGETDIVIASLIMTSEREEVIDFVAPYFHQSGISIMIRKPVRPTSLFKFMTVLRVEVWVSILGALTVTGIMIWLLDKYSPYSARNNKEMYPYPCREFTLKESFWFALTSFTPQGGGEAPKALSGRTLVAAYWLFVVLMLATFTANLAAFLTVERMKSPVESLEQLARQSRINYSVVRGSDTHKFFINMKKAEDTLYRAWKELALNASSDETQYRVWDYPIKEQYGHILLAIEQTGLVENETEGIQKVLDSEKGEFAFIHNEASIKYHVYKNCNLTEVGEVFAERPYAIAVQQGSQLQEEISRRILDLQKDRYFETQSAKFWNSSASGDCPNTDDSEGITLGSLGGVFIATLFGLALAMITLAGEILYHKHKDTIDSKFNQIRPQKKKKVEAAGFPSQISSIQRKGRITLGDSTLPTYRPTGPGKMMPRVSYISVFPKNQPIYD